MEEQNWESALQFAPLSINRMINIHSGLVVEGIADHLVVEGYTNQQYIRTEGTDGILQVPVPFSQWMHGLQTPQNYVKFLAESRYSEIQEDSEIQKEIRRNISQRQDWNGEQSNVFQPYLGSGAAAPAYPSEASRKRSREKAYAADRSRRLKISQRLDALQDLFPHAKEGGKAAMLDEIIEQVKYLQDQMKDLCQRRVGCESASSSFIFLEGHGHYLLCEQMLSGSLEEMMGKVLELNPAAAMELLQSRGLLLMPMAFAEGLQEPVEMLDAQERGKFLFTK